jgi:hypothetical protein
MMKSVESSFVRLMNEIATMITITIVNTVKIKSFKSSSNRPTGKRKQRRTLRFFPPFKHAILITVRSAHEGRAKLSAETLKRRLKEALA